jgi:hypothetical protein
MYVVCMMYAGRSTINACRVLSTGVHDNDTVVLCRAV